MFTGLCIHFLYTRNLHIVVASFMSESDSNLVGFLFEIFIQDSLNLIRDPFCTHIVLKSTITRRAEYNTIILIQGSRSYRQEMFKITKQHAEKYHNPFSTGGSYSVRPNDQLMSYTGRKFAECHMCAPQPSRPQVFTTTAQPRRLVQYRCRRRYNWEVAYGN